MRPPQGATIPPVSTTAAQRATGYQQRQMAGAANVGMGTSTFGPKSTAPVASDIDFDLELSAAAFKRKNRRVLLVAAGFVALAAIGIVIASQSSPEAVNTVADTKSRPLQLPPPPTPAPAKAPTPEPEEIQKPKPAADVATASSAGSKLSEDMKRALAEADRQREKQRSEKKRSKPKPAVAAPPAEAPAKESQPVFQASDDLNDPLNGNL